MAHNKGGTHAESGMTGIGKQYAHKIAHPIAAWLLGKAWFLSLLQIIGVDDPKMIANGIRVVAGYFNFPGGGVLMHWGNELSDLVAAEVAETLEKNPDILKMDFGIRREEIEGFARDDAGELLGIIDDKVFILGEAHDNRKCIRLKTIETAMTAPSRVGKNGKVMPGLCNAKIVETTLSEAMKGGVMLCSMCFPGGKVDDALFSPVGSARKTIFELLEELEGLEDQALTRKAKKFRREWMSLNDATRKKFILLAKQSGALDRLRIVIAAKKDEWDAVLDTMVTLPVPPKQGLMDKVVDGLEKIGGKFVDKLAEEGVETERVFDSLDNAFGKVDALNARHRTRIERQRAAIAAKKSEKIEMTPAMWVALIIGVGLFVASFLIAIF